MIVTISPRPRDARFDTERADALAIARAVELIGAHRGWRVSLVQFWDEQEGAMATVSTTPGSHDDE